MNAQHGSDERPTFLPGTTFLHLSDTTNMVSALVSASSGLGSSPGWTQYVVFLAIYSHSATLLPGVIILGGNPAMDWHPIRERRNSPSRFML